MGPGQPCFIIAEAGVNHNGDLELARQLVVTAKEAGAYAVKFQTFRAEKLVVVNAPKADYQKHTTIGGESQYDMLKQLELSTDAHRALVAYCNERDVLFLSTPFDEGSVDLLDSLGIPAFKIGSGDLTNLPLLRHTARKGKPMVISTGMAYLSELEQAVRTIQAAGNSTLALVHCVSNYPADPADGNLRAMHTMSAAFDLPVGYSDHTLGVEVALAAVALGACIIEKHFTFDRNLPGPDHQALDEPADLVTLAQDIRSVESALGHSRKEPAAIACRSLVSACDILAGTILDESMIVVKRPGTGLPSAMQPCLIGRTARSHISAGTLLTLEMLA